LHEACRSQSTDEDGLYRISRLLIDAGSDINSKSSDLGEVQFPICHCRLYYCPKNCINKSFVIMILYCIIYRYLYSAWYVTQELKPITCHLWLFNPILFYNVSAWKYFFTLSPYAVNSSSSSDCLDHPSPMFYNIYTFEKTSCSYHKRYESHIFLNMQVPTQIFIMS